MADFAGSWMCVEQNGMEKFVDELSKQKWNAIGGFLKRNALYAQNYGAGKTTMDISQDGNKYTMNISGIISTRTVEVVADGTEQEAKTDDGKKKVTAKIDGGKLIITATGAKHSPITSTFEVVDGKLVRTYTLEGVTGWTKFEKNDKK